MAGRGRSRLTGVLARLVPAGVLLGLSACAGLPSGVSSGVSPGASPGCTVTLAATLALDPGSEYAVVTGGLDGSPARYVLDTGAEASHVTPWAASRYALAPSGTAPTAVMGLGGVLLASNVVAEVALGGKQTRVVMPVVDLPINPANDQPFAGLLGADLLSAYDVELSFPERQVRLWQARGCSGDHTGWAGAHWPVPLHRTGGGRLQVPVVVDGTPVTALLDTGANVSILGTTAAARLNLTPALLAGDRAGRGRGVDGTVMTSRLHRFGGMAIGPELFDRPRLVVSSATIPEADMLLGVDWMRGRRIWISWANQQMFVQPAPGDAAGAVP